MKFYVYVWIGLVLIAGLEVFLTYGVSQPASFWRCC